MDLGVMVMKGYPTLLKAPGQEPHHQMLSVIPEILEKSRRAYFKAKVDRVAEEFSKHVIYVSEICYSIYSF